MKLRPLSAERQISPPLASTEAYTRLGDALAKQSSTRRPQSPACAVAVHVAPPSIENHASPLETLPATARCGSVGWNFTSATLLGKTVCHTARNGSVLRCNPPLVAARR